METLGLISLIGIIICLGIAGWAGLCRQYWRGVFALAEIVAIVLLFLATQNALTYHNAMQARQDMRPEYEPIRDSIGRE